MAAANGVGFINQIGARCKLFAVERNWPALVKADGDVFGFDCNTCVVVSHAHDWFDDVHAGRKFFKRFCFVSCAPNVGIGGVRLLGRVAVRQILFGEERAHFGATAHFANEVGIEPWFVNAQLWVGKQAVAIEALDVVALVRAAVAPDVDVVLLHCANEHGAGDGAAKRGGVEICFAGSGDVERAALQRNKTFVY